MTDHNGVEDQDLFEQWSQGSPKVKRLGLKPRRSLRVDIAPGLPVRLSGEVEARLVEVSLGGCVLETERRIPPGEKSSVALEYEGQSADLEVETYQSFLHELFYSDSGRSYLRYRSRTFYIDASIDALNIIYRIMADNYSPLAESLQFDPD
jgi:hypothetical protein